MIHDPLTTGHHATHILFLYQKHCQLSVKYTIQENKNNYCAETMKMKQVLSYLNQFLKF